MRKQPWSIHCWTNSVQHLPWEHYFVLAVMLWLHLNIFNRIGPNAEPAAERHVQQPCAQCYHQRSECEDRINSVFNLVGDQSRADESRTRKESEEQVSWPPDPLQA